jgi:hypothetical protein
MYEYCTNSFCTSTVRITSCTSLDRFTFCISLVRIDDHFLYEFCMYEYDTTHMGTPRNDRELLVLDHRCMAWTTPLGGGHCASNETNHGYSRGGFCLRNIAKAMVRTADKRGHAAAMNHRGCSDRMITRGHFWQIGQSFVCFEFWMALWHTPKTNCMDCLVPNVERAWAYNCTFFSFLCFVL